MSQLDLTRMWGSSAQVIWQPGAPNRAPETQVADIRLPEACVTSVYFQAEVLTPPAVATGVIQSLFLRLTIGLGRTTVHRVNAWIGVPTVGSPIQLTLPFVPAASILAQVGGIGNSLSLTDAFALLCTIEVSPIGRFPIKKEPLQLGMALPGEADGMDDAMYENLEEQHPETAEIMRARQAAGEHPGDFEDTAADDELDEDDEEEEESEGVYVVPPQMVPLINRLSRRLGRPATVRDLPYRLQKMIARRIREGA